MKRITQSSEFTVGEETEIPPSSSSSSSPCRSVSHGVVSVIGRKRAMDEALAAVTGLEIGGVENYFDFFAVYEGRGFGSAVSASCRKRMHLLVAMEAEKKGIGEKGSDRMMWWKDVIVNSFLEMDREIRSVDHQQPEHDAAGDDEEDEEDADAEKSTAVVVMVGKEEIVVANSGDCKAVLSRGGASLPLSGGNREHCISEGKVASAASKATGEDSERGVISEPEVTVTERSESDEFIIIASEGMWDVVSDDAACAVAAKCFESGRRMGFADETSENCAAGAAAFLAELAMARGSRENISVIVVKL
ncbi:Probable protein phosphatase 2C 8 [Linum grandiflorum]